MHQSVPSSFLAILQSMKTRTGISAVLDDKFFQVQTLLQQEMDWYYQSTPQ